MKVIHKKISLEQFKSRIDSKIRAYDSLGDVIDDNTINYNMFPYDVEYKGLIMSYPTLMERYRYCINYEKMLQHRNCSACEEDDIDDCLVNKIANKDNDKIYFYYENAIDYYNHTSNYKSHELYDYYAEMDRKYNEYGGSAFTKAMCDFIKDGKEGEFKYHPHDLSDFSNSAHINIQILFTNTIDDIGEMSIFSNEWEDGEDYRNYDTSLSSGTTVIYDDEIWQFKGSSNDDFGSLYSKRYKENYFPQISDITYDNNYQWYEKSNNKLEYSENQWVNNTELYFQGKIENNYIINGEKLKEEYTIFDNVVYDAKSNIDLISHTYNINKNDNIGFFVINDMIFKPFKSEYVIYNVDNTYFNGKPLLVYDVDEPNLNLKYCYIDGCKIYSKTNDNNEHYFDFIGDGKNVKNVEKDDTLFIIYNNVLYSASTDNVTFDLIDGKTITYPKIDGYSIIDGNNIYIKNDNVITFDRNENNNNITYSINTENLTFLGKKNSSDNGYYYKIINNQIKVFKPYIKYNINELSGYTESKLSSLSNYVTAYDDMGNELPGSLVQNEDGTYKQPKEGEFMDLPYKVGNVSDLTLYNEEEQIFWGNILTSITIFYEDYYGNKINDLSIECGYNESVIDKIEELKTNLKNYKSSNKDNIIKEHYRIIETIKCEFKYNIGAILNRENEKYSLSENEYEKGVEYYEIISLIDNDFVYNIDDFNTFNIKYYEFVYNSEFVRMDEYDGKKVQVNLSKFKYKITPLTNVNSDYRCNYDGMIAAPTFREEYKFGSSMMEKIESNIYIDRGFSSAFEKHLKLMEINSFESMSQYTNGFYNIIES